MKSNRAWEPKPLTKALTLSIISDTLLINIESLSICVPKAPPKIRKSQAGGKKKVLEGIFRNDKPKGKTTEHYLKFINDTLDIMNKCGKLKEFYLITDNAHIHTSA